MFFRAMKEQKSIAKRKIPIKKNHHHHQVVREIIKDLLYFVYFFYCPVCILFHQAQNIHLYLCNLC